MNETQENEARINEFQGVIGDYRTADELNAAIDQANAHGFRKVMAYMPMADMPGVERLMPDSSPVRWFSLVGGLTGIATALAMTIWMSWNYPLIVGGKPITSLPPFLVVAFELMILFGSIASIIGFMWFSRLPDLTPCDSYTPHFADDRFGLYVPCGAGENDRARAEQLLRDTGALEVRNVYHTERGRLQMVQ